MRRSNSSSAFTLIELLVVIGIIAILAAMLLPALNRAKTAADSATCRNNLRQLILATSTYVQQYNAYPGVTANTGLDPVQGQIEPFVGALFPKDNWSNQVYLGPTKSVFACPGYNRVHGEFRSLRSSPDGFLTALVTSYAYNYYGNSGGASYGLTATVNDGPGSVTVRMPLRENQVVKTTEMIAFGDAPTWPQQSATYGSAPVQGYWILGVPLVNMAWNNAVLKGLPAGDTSVQAMTQRHGGKWNVVLCDGHVETLKPKDLFDRGNSAVACRWNNDNQPHNP